MNFAFVLKSLQFYDLKEKSPLRLIFILLFSLRLALNIFQLQYLDFLSLINSYLDGTNLSSAAEILGQVETGHVYYLLATLIAFLIQFFFVYLYATVICMELQPKLRNPLILQIEAEEKPRSLLALIAKSRSFIWLYRKRRQIGFEIPKLIERASKFARESGREAISESDIRKAEEIITAETTEQELEKTSGRWVGKSGLESREDGESMRAELADTYLLDYRSEASGKLWAYAAKSILSNAHRLLLCFLLAIVVFVLSLPLLSIPFFIFTTAFAFAPLNIILNKDEFSTAAKRSAYAQKGFKMMLFSQFIILRLAVNLPYYLLSSAFYDSPYSLAIIESLVYVLLTLTGGRLLGIMYSSVAFKQEAGKGEINA